MSEEPTVPHVASEPSGPVERVCIRVLEGPNLGRSFEARPGVVTVGSAQGNDLLLSDPTVSRYHLDLEPSADGVLVKDNGSRNGTFVGAVRVQRAVVPAGSVLRLGDSHIEIETEAGAEPELYPGTQLVGLYGRSRGMRQLMAQVERVADSSASVMILGESGTGKERIAQALHALSGRKDGPFVTVDCGALTPNLIASELFGHERGAFTGADRRHVGSLERAQGGTLFLDEVAELPLEMQPVLLGALERRRIRRVGGTAEIDVDVRLVCATHRDIREAVNNGAFRLDLYYRVAVVVLRVPALRDRVDDIPMLVEHFLREAGEPGEAGRLFSQQELEGLRTHHWPGNVRELRNLVEASMALGSSPQSLLQDEPRAETLSDSSLLSNDYKRARELLLHDFERRYLSHWLDRAGGNVAKAARLCRMDRSHLFQMLRRHGLR